MATGAMAAEAGPLPWRAEELVRLVATDLVALALLTVAWFNAAGTVHLARQVRWIDLGVVALVVTGVGHTRWLLAGRRAVGRRSRDLGDTCRERVVPAPEPAAPVLVAVEGFVQAAGMSRVHVAGCPLLVGKTAGPATTDGPPCGICRR